MFCIASWIGIEVYNDTTSKLHGYGNIWFREGSRERMLVMNSMLFLRWAGTSLSSGVRILVSNQEIFIVGP